MFWRNKMKVGDLVRFNKNSVFYKKGERFIGRVKNIQVGTSIEEHGSIEVELLKCEKYYLPVGEMEHFVHFNWQKDLEIIEDLK